MLRPLDRHRCPVEQALELVAGKWKPMILWHLGGGTLRYNALRRALPGVSQRMLTLHLRELERDGLVRRTVHPGVPPQVDYTLEAPAQALLPTLGALGHWLLEQHAGLAGSSPASLLADGPVAPGRPPAHLWAHPAPRA